MAKRIAKEEYENIVSTLEEYPDGASLKDLLGSSSIDESRSTLIRRLETLLRLGKIYKKGERKSARYFAHYLAPEVRDLSPELQISKKGLLIQESVKKPLSERKSSIYEIGFLDEYVPNQTYYPGLPPIFRQWLFLERRRGGSR